MKTGHHKWRRSRRSRIGFGVVGGIVLDVGPGLAQEKGQTFISALRIEIVAPANPARVSRASDSIANLHHNAC
jgi:hypothetical protein